jgi:hypothetical protein
MTDNTSEKTVSSHIPPVFETPLVRGRTRFLDPTIADAIMDKNIHYSYFYWVILKENCAQTGACRTLDGQYP